MACFLVPAAEAVVTTLAAKLLKSREKARNVEIRLPDGSVETATRIPFSTKLGWLNKLLWGGSALLAFEHVWHGEVVPFFPFLTAASDPAEAAVMLDEMASVGGSMALFLTGVWAVMLFAAHRIQKKALYPQLSTK